MNYDLIELVKVLKMEKKNEERAFSLSHFP